jgi:hypothetical protein
MPILDTLISNLDGRLTAADLRPLPEKVWTTKTSV